ncbi:hypothetical protein D3C84_877590 [compost metagenome]
MPVIASLRLPCRTSQRPAGNPAQARCSCGVLADLRGVWVSGVQQQTDVLIANELRQPLGTAVTADANLALQIRRHAADPGQAVNVLRPQRAGDGQCLGDAAEQQNAFH